MSSNYQHYFSIADYCVFSVAIVVSLGIGVYYALSGGKQRTTSEYFVGNRRMNFLPVAISLMVSFESSIMMLGSPAEVYVYGLQYWMGNFGFTMANIMAIFVFVPLVHPLKITSAYEYLELRFKSSVVRKLGTLLGIISYTMYMGIVLFGPAIALEGVTGFPQWASILAVALASVIYTSIGGLKAVIWTDVFQCVVMFSGFFAVLIKGTIQIGGIKKTWDIAYAKGRVNMFNFDPDPTVRHTFWSLFVGSLIRGTGFIFNQSSVQRICSTPNIKEAKRVMYYVTPGFFVSLSLALVEGIVAYAYYDTKGCDPLASKQIRNPNQIIPLMVMEIFEGLNGMPGLFMASLFCASLSTLSSGLSSVSALFWTDLVKPHVGPISELKATIISKISVVVFGGIAVFVAVMIDLIGGTLVQISGSLLASFSGPLAGMFLFGAFCPFGNAKGTFYGSLLSTIVTFGICLGQMTTKGAVKNTRLPSAPTDFCPGLNGTAFPYDMYDGITNATMTMVTSVMETNRYDVPEPTGFRRLFMVSYKWFGPIGIIQVFVFGTIISYLTGFTKPEDIDKRTVMSFYDTLFPFLPECMLKPLRCGYDDLFDKSKVYENGDSTFIKQDVYDADIVIEQPEKVNMKLVKNNADIEQKLATMIDAKLKPETEHEDQVSLSDVLVSTSVDDLGGHRIPIRNMEFEITKVKGSVDDISGKKESVFLVLDKTHEERILKFKAKSIEFDIIPGFHEDEVETSSSTTIDQSEGEKELCERL